MPAPRSYLNNPKCIQTLLARWEDDRRFYQVELVSVDDKADKSLVKFEDGLSYPIANKDLHLSVNLDEINDEAILCCLCEKHNSELPNLIIICDLCNLGYHVGCHQPPIDATFWDDSDKEWFCSTCIEITNPVRRKRKRSVDEASPLRRKSKSARKTSTPQKVVKPLLVKKIKRTQHTKVVSQVPDARHLSPAEPDESPTRGEKQVEILRDRIHEQLQSEKPDILVAPENQDPMVGGAQDLRISESHERQLLADGSMVEEMDPIVIEAAKSLADPVPTQDFLSSVLPKENAEHIVKIKSTKVKQGVMKIPKIKISRKKDSAKPVPA